MKLACVAALALLTPTVALAGPAGKWRVGDGTAVVQIRDCDGGGLCGHIAWTSDKDGRDENNPVAANRARPLVGLPILRLAKQSENLWSGDVYNAQNGQNYSARLSQKSDAQVVLQGCVPGTNICGEDSWTRVK
jgi:uncharacterized protein (DUF2147 family)